MVRFLEKFRTKKFPSEITWPLVRIGYFSDSNIKSPIFMFKEKMTSLPLNWKFWIFWCYQNGFHIFFQNNNMYLVSIFLLILPIIYFFRFKEKMTSLLQGMMPGQDSMSVSSYPPAWNPDLVTKNMLKNSMILETVLKMTLELIWVRFFRLRCPLIPNTY